jgi:ribosomal protein S14
MNRTLTEWDQRFRERHDEQLRERDAVCGDCRALAHEVALCRDPRCPHRAAA